MQRLDCGLRPERNFLSGERFDLSEEVRIEIEAKAGEFVELGRIFRIGTGEHAGCSPGRLAHGPAALEGGDADATRGKFESQRQSYDPSAGNDNFCCFHTSILS